MADVRVTKQFKEDYDYVTSYWVSSGEWTQQEVDGLRQLMRDYELADGTDRLRDDLVHYTPDGEEQPSAINDPKDRYALWENWFHAKANDIRKLYRMAA